jgi:hypothetical protein
MKKNNFISHFVKRVTVLGFQMSIRRMPVFDGSLFCLSFRRVRKIAEIDAWLRHLSIRPNGTAQLPRNRF